jgi:hypothetical protein
VFAGRSPGLSAPLAALMLLTAGFVGGAIDAATGVGLRLSFAVLFVAGSVVVARFIRPRDRVAAFVMPPLVYAAVAVVFGGDVGSSAASLPNHVMALVTTLITSAPALLIALGLMVVITAGRGIAARMGRRMLSR